MKRLFQIWIVLFLFATTTAGQPVTEIVSPVRAEAMTPFLFATQDGVLLSWLEPIPNSDRVALRFARFANGSWSEPRTVVERNDFFVNWADFPSVIADANGVLFAHWLQKSSKSTYAYDVRMTVSKDRGATWSTPFVLNRDGKKNEHGFATLAPLAKGGVAATWLDGRNMVEGKEEGEMMIRYATIDARGMIASDVALDDRTCECCTTGMAITKNGPLIVYRDRSADEIRDIAVVRQSANGWTKPKLVHADGWKIAGCPVNGPQADAIDRRVAVAWFTAAQDQGRVFIAFSDDGGSTFAAPIRINDGKTIGRVDVAMLDSESAMVTWIEQTPGGGEIRARRVSRAGKLGPGIKIADSSTARAAGFPRTAVFNGNAFFAWTEQNATSKRIHIALARF